MNTRGLLTVMLLLIGATALADSDSQRRTRAFARLPDWTGIWIPDDGVMNKLGLAGRPDDGFWTDIPRTMLCGRPNTRR
jgi:hypothetical protein